MNNFLYKFQTNSRKISQNRKVIDFKGALHKKRNLN